MQVARDEISWPSWVGPAAAVPAVVLAALTPFVHHTGERNLALYLLLGLAALPWVLDAFGVPLHGRPVFAVWTLVPLAFLNLGAAVIGLDPLHDAQLSLMLLVWAVGCVASTSPVRLSVPYAVVAGLIPVVRFGYIAPADELWLIWLAGITMAAVTGFVMRRQQHLVLQLQAAQAALADEAALQERHRIAREIHDVIAHSLTVTMLHLTAARRAVRRDADEAEEALTEAERLGRRALTDVRRTVGLLHAGEGSATDSPLPAASDIPALVDSFVSAGAPVTMHCRAELERLTPAGGLALYRAVQEALANATKHAPGTPVSVSITEDADGVLLRVENPAAGNGRIGRGTGLLGMRDRIEALGGSVDAGRRNGSWVVSCSIPTAP